MILVNKSELGAGTRGASLGFEALRIESIKRKPITKVEYLENRNELLFGEKTKHKHAKNIDGIVDSLYSNLDQTKSFLAKEYNHIIYSADHASTPIYLAALKANNPNEQIGLIWIDAHADLHSPYTTPSGNIHGMSVSILLAEDNLSIARNKLTNEELDYWEKLKNLGIKGSKIRHENIAYLGLRDLEKEEQLIIDKNQILALKVPEIRQNSFENISQNILNKLVDCDRIYISFDVDSMDPNDVSFGTGTPVEEGFRFDEVVEIIDNLTNTNKKISFEMVEINPLLDHNNKMARKSLEIFELIAGKLKVDY